MRKNKPDIVITRQDLPDGKGLDILKSYPEEAKFPLLLLVEQSREKDGKRALEAGALNYLVKTGETLRALPHIIEPSLRGWHTVRSRRKAELALKDSEANYRAMVESFDGLIYICSQDYRVTFMNERLIERTGYDGTGQLCYRVLHNLDEKCPWCVNERVFRGDTVRWEVKSPMDNRWYYIVNTPIIHADESISKQALILDITERKRAEEMLRKSEEKFSKAFKLTPDSLLLTRLKDGKVIDCNDSFLKTMGYQKDEVLLRFAPSIRNWVRDEDRRTFLQQLRDTGKCENLEAVLMTKQNGSIYTLISAQTIEIEEKACVISIMRDITRQKRTEEEIKQHRDHLDELVRERTAELMETNRQLQTEISVRRKAEEALRASEYKYKTLLENLPQRIFYKDRNLVYISCNQHFADDLNIKADEISGRTDFDLFESSLAEQYRDDDQRVMASGRIEEIEEMFTAKDRLIPVQTVKTPIKDDQDNIIGIQGIFWDISRRKKIEAEKAKYQKQLRSLSSELLLTEESERRRIASDLHDRIGQALAISKIKLGLLQENMEIPEMTDTLNEVRGYIDQTINDTRTLTFEISPPVLYQFGLGAAIEWLVDQLSARHGISISYRNDGGPDSMDESSSFLLFRAIRELLLNVIKHAQASQVEITLSCIDDQVRIEVSDNGIGFNTSEIEYPSGISKEFGLFSLKERLSHLRGTIAIHSHPGQGTRVALTAPLRASQ